MKLLGSAVFALILTMSVSLALATGQGDAKKGQELYKARCSMCHGDHGEGKAQIGKMFGVQMKEFASKEVQSLTDAQLKKDITQGNGKMQPVKLSDAEVANAIAYIRSLAKEKK